MRWPWVSRHRLNGYRRLYNETAKLLVAAESAKTFLTQQLELCQRERADLQLKLLRAGFGVNPFYELIEAQAGNHPPAQAPAEPAAAPELSYAASPEQVQEHFVREAIDIFGPANMRAVKNHVERRQAEFYAGRTNPIAPSIDEAAAAARVAADLEAAIQEGRESDATNALLNLTAKG